MDVPTASKNKIEIKQDGYYRSSSHPFLLFFHQDVFPPPSVHLVRIEFNALISSTDGKITRGDVFKVDLPPLSHQTAVWLR